jgi:hypothetical protein
MLADLQLLLADTLPADLHATTVQDGYVRAHLRVDGAEHPATVSRVMGPHFIVAHPGVRLAPNGALVLSILVGSSGVRLDAPVDVVRTEPDEGWSTLRLRGRPLVIRRRIVRNRQLEQALGGGDDDVPMVA